MKVYWTPWCEYQKGDLRTPECMILFEEPTPVYKELSPSRDMGSDNYFKCPAFIDLCKNTYVVKAPFDLDVHYNQLNETLHISQAQDIYDLYCTNRPKGPNARKIITLPPRYLFYSDDDIMMESLPCFLQNSKIKWDLIPGKYNIGKWIRPIDFTIELHDEHHTLHFKKNDPLFYIRFTTKNDDKIELERVEFTKQLYDLGDACTAVKKRQGDTPLKTLYESAESFLKAFRKSKK